jgi:HSP20 family protein
MTIGPDGKPRVREFGNVRRSPFGATEGREGGGEEEGLDSTAARPLISSEREPLADIITTDKEVKVIVEMLGISEENIKINAYDTSLEVKSDNPQRKYHQVIDLPPEAAIETAKSAYKNGILEITFQKKKEQRKPKG